MKYKLKKWYPSLPKDWEVGQIFIETTCNFGKKYIPENSTNLEDYFTGIFKSEVENNPDFWEKIEEEYEILKLINTDTGEILSDKENINSWLEGYAKTIWNINSVKRLNDNTIFTIGDNVYNPNCKSQTFVIESFYLDCNSKHMLCGSGHINITKIEHCRKPIFISEDGVEIFERDKYWIVKKDWSDFYSWVCSNSHKMIENNIYFSTKEKAEEYINLNKPKYSEKDMLSFGLYARGICLTPVNIYSRLVGWKFENNK